MGGDGRERAWQAGRGVVRRLARGVGLALQRVASERTADSDGIADVWSLCPEVSSFTPMTSRLWMVQCKSLQGIRDAANWL